MGKRIVYSTVLICLLFSCKNSENEGVYDHGRIEYEITYLTDLSGVQSIDKAFLPKRMYLDFNQDVIISRIEGFFGMFRLINQTNYDDHELTTFLKILEKKYYSKGNMRTMMCCYEEYNDISFSKDTSTKVLAGLNSKAMKVELDDSGQEFLIYYTDEINLKKPNINNPYKKIDGVLTEFRLRMEPYNMLFTAIEFDPETNPEKNIDLPKGSIKVSYETMYQLMDRLMKQNR